MIGKTFFNYKILKELGEGGMGTVYLAEHITLGTKSALKVLFPHLAQNEAMSERFMREAKAQAALKHPYIIRVIDYLESDAYKALVMEYIEGKPLSRMLEEKKGSLSYDEILQIIEGPLQALNYAHSRGIVHRDVKPSNIIIDSDNKGYITDFGIAMILGMERKTLTGANLGTPHYMSPEQIRHPHKVDHRTDVYAMGVVLFEMVAGEVPFGGTTDFDIKEGHIYQRPPLEKIKNRIPEKMMGVLKKALEKNQEDRFSGCGEMLRALTEGEEPAAAAASPAVRENPKQKPSAKPKRSAVKAPQIKIYKKEIICDWSDMEMVLIPEGEFLMGSAEGDQNAEDDEKPQHIVYLDSYYIGKYPVTNKQYAEYLKERCINQRRIIYRADEGLGNYPVVEVNWHESVEFTKWLSKVTGKKYRLPSEAEWEKAARGGLRGMKYPNGDSISPSETNYDGSDTVRVRSYSPNGYGLYDMVGYIWQWCSDLYNKNYFKNCSSRSPQGPSSGSFRVLRGGSWGSLTYRICAGPRVDSNTTDGDDLIGFRCVRKD